MGEVLKPYILGKDVKIKPLNKKQQAKFDKQLADTTFSWIIKALQTR